ncbi:MAG: DUF3127 domain-containing protein [Cytophagales bacterium]|nr:DUF3127 domain-containing protein [Cytophagales bacterium]
MKITGKLLEVKDIQQISDTFKKREFIVEYAENPNYPEYLVFELIQERCNLIDPLKVGQEIEVNFNLRGRKWINPEGVTKYFISLQAWRLEAMSNLEATSNEVDNKVADEESAKDEESSAQDNPVNTSEEDDLPF